MRREGLRVIAARRAARGAALDDSAPAENSASQTGVRGTESTLLDLLLNATDSEAGAASAGLTDAELLDNAVTFLFAGAVDEARLLSALRNESPICSPIHRPRNDVSGADI